MAFIYENDVTRLGGNLQTTIAYLLSLHKAEYEWNLLGIKVVGHVDALPIPDGTYEYGDAYTVGTSAPYDMWIYTRADEFHSSAYWFNIGKFPAPGPQGPKGDGWETAQLFQEGITANLTYDSTNGGRNESISSMTYVDSTTGRRLAQNFQMVSRLPIIPGKYVSMDATADNKAIKVKVDDTQLELDYYKINKTDVTSVPTYSPKKGRVDTRLSFNENQNSLVVRGANGEARFRWILADMWNKSGSEYMIDFDDVVLQLIKGRLVVGKTTSDTGTLTVEQLVQFQRLPQIQLHYDGQTYYRMDPMTAPDGTLNFVHLDSVQDGNSGYKATGKCFSIKVSTRAWQVVDLNFVTPIYKHDIFMRVNGSGSDSWAIRFTVTTSNSTEINSTTLAKYIYGGANPDPTLMSGTPVSVYIENISDSAGLGLGRIAYLQSDPNVTPIYLWEFTDMNHAHTLSGTSTQYKIERIVDTVTEV